MASPKVSKPVSRAVAQRQHGHSLAPEHLGEAGAAATLVVAIGGMAIFIASLAMTVGGLTLASSYGGATPPPTVSQIGMSQVFAGIGLLVLGLLIVGSAAALLSNLRGSLQVTAGVCAITALLAGAGTVVLAAAARRDMVLAAALAVAFIAFGGAAFVLARLRR